MSVIKLLGALYGAPFIDYTNHIANDADIVVKKIASNNPNRVELIITNNSINRVYIHTANNVSANLSIVIAPSATITIEAWKDGMLPTLDWYAMADADNSRITIREVIMAGENT